jgi:hypothetical protein
MSDAVPARIFVVPSPKSSRAIVIRRGPTRYFAVMGWDRATDEIQLGQWFRGQMYPQESYLSPNGEHFIYSAGNGNPNSETGGFWTAISRYPYLHAITMWPASETYQLGGVFLGNGKFVRTGQSTWFRQIKPIVKGVWNKEQLRGAVWKSDLSQEVMEASEDDLEQDRLGLKDVYKYKYTSTGWNDVSCHGATSFQKSLGTWELHRENVDWAEKRDARESIREKFTFFHELSRETISMDDWDWADVWQDELRFSKAGSLFKAESCKKMGFKNVKLIQDFNAMTFQPIRAPYDSRISKRVWP